MYKRQVLRRVDEALGEARHDGKAFPDPEGGRGLEPGRVTGRPARGVLGAGTLGTGVPGDLLHLDVLRQGEMCIRDRYEKEKDIEIGMDVEFSRLNDDGNPIYRFI